MGTYLELANTEARGGAGAGVALRDRGRRGHRGPGRGAVLVEVVALGRKGSPVCVRPARIPGGSRVPPPPLPGTRVSPGWGVSGPSPCPVPPPRLLPEPSSLLPF